MKSHPYADLFPMMSEADIQVLSDDIVDRGQEQPVVLYEGRVLDGRNRLAACALVGLVADTVDYKGDDPLGFVLSLNLTRRHLTTSQRAMIAAELATWDFGVNQHSVGSSDPTTLKRAAKRLSVGETITKAAKNIRHSGAPELIEVVVSGDLSVETAGELAHIKKTQQKRLLKLSQDEIIKAAKIIRRERQEETHASRLRVHASMAARSVDLPSGQKWPVLYADPPWKQEVWGDVTGHEKSAVNHYPTMEWEDIFKLCEGDKSPAMRDAVLYLWIPSNNIITGLECMTRWGFEYASQLIWDKVNQGTGRWVFDCHEVLLIGKRGDMPAPLPGTQPQSIHSEPRQSHSRKPAHFAEAIERCFPDIPKLELFNRKQSLEEGDIRHQTHWTLWGNEALTEIEEDAA